MGDDDYRPFRDHQGPSRINPIEEDVALRMEIEALAMRALRKYNDIHHTDYSTPKELSVALAARSVEDCKGLLNTGENFWEGFIQKDTDLEGLCREQVENQISNLLRRLRIPNKYVGDYTPEARSQLLLEMLVYANEYFRLIKEFMSITPFPTGVGIMNKEVH